tara:strand:- start:621 stop:1154 length:534 start_codon:yes stop_codon:yes gene_type:complete
MDKRGVSPVVATVLLILLTIAGISIIAGVLIPFVSNSLETSTACIEYRNYYTFSNEFSFNCYKEYSTPAANGHAITLRAGSDSEVGEGIKGFELIFLKEGSSKKVTILNRSDVPGGVQMLGGGDKFEVPQPGEIRTYIVNDSSLYTGIEVYPILASEKVCDLSDSVILHLCPDGTNF